MMIVGDAEVGKTTMRKWFVPDSMFEKLSSKRTTKKDDRTVGLDHYIWEEKANSLSFRVSIWDSAGQDRYFGSHQLFLSSSCLFVILFDLSKKETQLRLTSWLFSIQSRVADAHVIVIGTHLINSKTKKPNEFSKN